MNKFLLYMKQILLLSTGNKLRYILTFIGIAIGILIYSLGTMVLDSYYYAQYKEIRLMPEHSFYYTMDASMKELKNELLFDVENNPTMQRISNYRHTIFEKKQSETQTTVVAARVSGLTSMSDTVLSYDDAYGYNMIPIHLLSGRVLTQQEIDNNERVCLIDEYTKLLIWGEKDAIGEYIYFNKYNGGIYEDGSVEYPIQAYKVVGVIKNSYYSEKERNRVESKYSLEDPLVYTTVNMYFPYGVYMDLNEDESSATLGFVWNGIDYEDKENKKQKVESTIEAEGEQLLQTYVIDADWEINKLEYELQPIRQGINYVIVGLILITGFSLMSIMFFAMKERTEEIGIKKAFGATWLDITFQFICENLLIAIVASLLAIFISILIAIGSEGYIRNYLFYDYTTLITWKTVLQPLLLGMVETIIFTMIPSIRYSFMQVTTALRIDS